MANSLEFTVSEVVAVALSMWLCVTPFACQVES